MTLDRFFSKKKNSSDGSSVSESQPSTSGFKRRRESTSEGYFLMEYISSSKQ